MAVARIVRRNAVGDLLWPAAGKDPRRGLRTATHGPVEVATGLEPQRPERLARPAQGNPSRDVFRALAATANYERFRRKYREGDRFSFPWMRASLIAVTASQADDYLAVEVEHDRGTPLGPPSPRSTAAQCANALIAANRNYRPVSLRSPARAGCCAVRRPGSTAHQYRPAIRRYRTLATRRRTPAARRVAAATPTTGR